MIPKLYFPRDEGDAIMRIAVLLETGEVCGSLVAADDELFLAAWHAISWIFPGLHPDGSCEAVGETRLPEEDLAGWPEFLKGPYRVESGWPLTLEPVAMEAWRRYEAGLILDEEFYCAEIAHRRLSLERANAQER